MYAVEVVLLFKINLSLYKYAFRMLSTVTTVQASYPRMTCSMNINAQL
jgi:hypothetical protein